MAAPEAAGERPPSRVCPKPGCCQVGEGSCKGCWGVSALGKRPAPPVSPKPPAGEEAPPPASGPLPNPAGWTKRLLGGGFAVESLTAGADGGVPPNIPAKLPFSAGSTKLDPPEAAPGTGAVDSPVGKGLAPPGPKPAGGKRLPAPAGAAGGTVETGGKPEKPPPGCAPSETRGGKGLARGPEGVGSPPPKAEPGKAAPACGGRAGGNSGSPEDGWGAGGVVSPLNPNPVSGLALPLRGLSCWVMECGFGITGPSEEAVPETG